MITTSEIIEIKYDGEHTKRYFSIEEHKRLIETFFNESDLKHMIIVLELSLKSKNYSKGNPYFKHTEKVIYELKEILITMQGHC